MIKSRRTQPSVLSGMLSSSGCRSMSSPLIEMTGARHARGLICFWAGALDLRAMPHAMSASLPSTVLFSNEISGVRCRSLVRVLE